MFAKGRAQLFDDKMQEALCTTENTGNDVAGVVIGLRRIISRSRWRIEGGAARKADRDRKTGSAICRCV